MNKRTKLSIQDLSYVILFLITILLMMTPMIVSANSTVDSEVNRDNETAIIESISKRIVS